MLRTPPRPVTGRTYRPRRSPRGGSATVGRLGHDRDNKRPDMGHSLAQPAHARHRAAERRAAVSQCEFSHPGHLSSPGRHRVPVARKPLESRSRSCRHRGKVKEAVEGRGCVRCVRAACAACATRPRGAWLVGQACAKVHRTYLQCLARDAGTVAHSRDTAIRKGSLASCRVLGRPVSPCRGVLNAEPACMT